MSAESNASGAGPTSALHTGSVGEHRPRKQALWLIAGRVWIDWSWRIRRVLATTDGTPDSAVS